MNKYTNFDFYHDNYLGDKFINDEKFAFYLQMACAKIRSITCNKSEELSEYSEDLQMCTCEIIDYLKDQDKLSSDQISSESLGNRSVTYKQGKTSAQKDKDMNEIANKWLAGSYLLYKGVR